MSEFLRDKRILMNEVVTPWNYYARIEIPSSLCNRGFGIALKIIGSQNPNSRQSKVKRGISAIAKACGGNISKTQVKSILMSRKNRSKTFIKMPFSATEIIGKILISVDPSNNSSFVKEKSIISKYKQNTIDDIRKVELLIWKYIAELENVSEKIDDSRFSNLMEGLRRLD